MYICCTWVTEIDWNPVNWALHKILINVWYWKGATAWYWINTPTPSTNRISNHQISICNETDHLELNLWKRTTVLKFKLRKIKRNILWGWMPLGKNCPQHSERPYWGMVRQVPASPLSEIFNC
jgi:hypothetical protein